MPSAAAIAIRPASASRIVSSRIISAPSPGGWAGGPCPHTGGEPGPAVAPGEIRMAEIEIAQRAGDRQMGEGNPRRQALDLRQHRVDAAGKLPAPAGGRG